MIKSSKFNHPAAIIASGSSGTGKTTFALNLVKHQHFTKKIKNLYYFGCNGLRPEFANWQDEFSAISVICTEGLPSESFFENIKKNSFVIIDDQFDDAIENPIIAKAFKVFRRHLKFSIILITQRLFEKGTFAKAIRDNCEIFALFKNYGDAKTNVTFASRIDLKKRYLKSLAEVQNVKHGYIVINNATNFDKLRIGYNIFGELEEFGPYPLFMTE